MAKRKVQFARQRVATSGHSEKFLARHELKKRKIRRR